MLRLSEGPHKVLHVPPGSETLPWNGRGTVPPARYRRRVVLEPEPCRRLPLMHSCVQLCADSLHMFLDDRLVRPEP